jgi:hypothetical protein
LIIIKKTRKSLPWPPIAPKERRRLLGTRNNMHISTYSFSPLVQNTPSTILNIKFTDNLR